MGKVLRTGRIYGHLNKVMEWYLIKKHTISQFKRPSIADERNCRRLKIVWYGRHITERIFGCYYLTTCSNQ